jgi:hypothetical protein
MLYVRIFFHAQAAHYVSRDLGAADCRVGSSSNTDMRFRRRHRSGLNDEYNPPPRTPTSRAALHGTGARIGTPLSTIQVDTTMAPSGPATTLCTAPRTLKKI